MRVETIIFSKDVYPKKNSRTISAVGAKANSPGSYKKGNRWYRRFLKCSDRFYEWHDAELARLLGDEIENFVTPFNMVYRFYPGSLVLKDISNQVEGINDLLVDAKIIPDDCQSYLRSLHPQYIHYDWENPRIEVDIIQLPRTDHCEAMEILKNKEKLKAIAKAEKTTQVAVTLRCKEILGRPPQALILEEI